VKSALRSEVLKITTVPGLWVGALLATIATPLLSLLVVATGGLGEADTVVSGAATASVAGLLAFGAWGAVTAAGEYANNTMSVSLQTVPNRSVFYGAKLAAVGAVAAAAGLVSALVSLGIVRLIISPGEHDFGNPAALIALVLAIVAVAVTGASVGILTRSPTASIGIIVVAILLPKAAGSLLGGLERWVVGASPGTVVTQIVGGAQLPVDQTFPPGDWAAALAMVVIAAIVAAAGAVVLTRRDT
jgi:hypothetical protein